MLRRRQVGSGRVSPGGNSDVGAMSAMRAHAFAPGDINEKDISILGSLRQTEEERAEGGGRARARAANLSFDLRLGLPLARFTATLTPTRWHYGSRNRPTRRTRKGLDDVRVASYAKLSRWHLTAGAGDLNTGRLTARLPAPILITPSFA